VTLTFSFASPEAKPSPRNYWSAVATFGSPVPLLSKEEIVRVGTGPFTERMYRRIRREVGDFISRQGKKTGVTKWQIILTARVYRESEPITLDPFDSKFAASDLFDRHSTTFKPFFFAAMDQAIANTGVMGASAQIMALFELQVRAYRPSGPRFHE
jgi:hypothetical protein